MKVNNVVATINKMTVWLNWLIGFLLFAALLMIVGGTVFARTYSSGPMSKETGAINTMGVNTFLIGLIIFAILFTIYIIIAIIRLRTIKQTTMIGPLGNYKKVSKIWILILILMVGFPAWVLILASLIPR